MTTIHIQSEIPQITDAISWSDALAIVEAKQQKKIQTRRRRVARRLTRKTGKKGGVLFIVEQMNDEFPDYTWEQYEKDIKGMKPRQSAQKGKNRLKRYGRYPVMQRLLRQYHFDKDPEKLKQANDLRKKMTKPYKMMYRKGGEERLYQFPATYSYEIIKRLASLKWNNWKHLKEQVDEITRYCF
ncbi:MAG: hypothetical protein ACPG5P_01130 [Saprospiraceae bacterium]